MISQEGFISIVLTHITYLMKNVSYLYHKFYYFWKLEEARLVSLFTVGLGYLISDSGA